MRSRDVIVYCIVGALSGSKRLLSEYTFCITIATDLACVSSYVWNTGKIMVILVKKITL